MIFSNKEIYSFYKKFQVSSLFRVLTYKEKLVRVPGIIKSRNSLES